MHPFISVFTVGQSTCLQVAGMTKVKHACAAIQFGLESIYLVWTFSCMQDVNYLAGLYICKNLMSLLKLILALPPLYSMARKEAASL